MVVRSSGSSPQAFRWSAATGTVGLGNLPGGSASQAFACNDDGSVIVGDSTVSGGDGAFVWTAATGMRSLAAVLHANGINPTADGWRLLNTATGVRADGLTVSGYGTRTNGRTEAFVAVIPEPATLVAAGPLVLLRRRRR